jgi:Flp pilus assembly protein TadD
MKKISQPGLWGIIFIVLAVLVAYWPALQGGFIWDDDDYVTHNQALRNLHGLQEIWFNPGATPQYYPLAHTTFWLEYHLWGLTPLGFHVVNVLLHTLGSLLLWRVLAQLKVPGAWLAAAIFALHPVQVESVAWITERKNVLSAVFYFLATLAYLRFANLENKDTTGKQRWYFYSSAFALFVAALLCKTVTCSLPVALLLVLWWNKGRLRLPEILPLIPFFLIGLCLGLVTAWLEKQHVGAHGADWSLTLTERCLVASRAVCFYLAKLICPVRLIFLYPRWEMNPGLWWQWLFPTAVVGGLAGLWLARIRIGRGPLVAALFFVSTLAPALGFVNVYPMRFTFVADHYQYLACIGPIALFAGVAAHFSQKWRMNPASQYAPALLLLLVLATLTYRQARNYQNLETLWRDTLAKNPAAWMAHTNLGWLLTAQGNLAEAESHYREALRLKSDNEDAHYDYGNMLVKAGRFDEATAQYRQALQLNPADAEVWNNLGVVLYQEHRTPESVACFRQAIHYKPGFPDAHFNLGNAMYVEHKLDEAIAEYREALRLEPDSVTVQNRLRALGVPVN